MLCRLAGCENAGPMKNADQALQSALLLLYVNVRRTHVRKLPAPSPSCSCITRSPHASRRPPSTSGGGWTPAPAPSCRSTCAFSARRAACHTRVAGARQRQGLRRARAKSSISLFLLPPSTPLLFVLNRESSCRCCCCRRRSSRCTCAVKRRTVVSRPVPKRQSPTVSRLQPA
jgi:hypothetical protein